MNYFDKFLKFIKDNQLIKKNDRILISFSGGPDSIFLTHFLINISKNYNLKLGLFHLNHQLRGEFSDNDEEFSVNFANKNNLPIYNKKVNIKYFSKINNLTIEEGGRKIRYLILEKLSKKYHFNKIATAHHYDDYIETFFINLFRGRGIRSFELIKLKNNKIIRPILNFTKKEILDYLDYNNIEYQIDYSNFEKKYLRNKIRIDLIPFIEKNFSSSFKSHIYNLSEQVKDLNNFLDDEIQKIFKKAVTKDKSGLNITISKLPQNNFILFEFLKKIFNEFDCYDYNRKVLNNLRDFIYKYQGKFIFKNIIFYKEYNNIFVEKKINKKNFYKIEIFKNFNKIDFKNKGKFEEFIDGDKLKQPLTIRYFKNGDRFHPLGFKSSIKLKKFFINQKIPFRIRRNIPLVIDNEGDIIWVAGYRISEKVKIDKSNNILKITITKQL